MEGIPQSFLDFIPTASPETKIAMITILQDSIQQGKANTTIAHEKVIVTTKNIDDYVTLIPDFSVDKTLLANVEKEVKSLNLISNSDKLKTQWLNSTTDGYKYGTPGHELEHTSKPIEEFEHINQLMTLINNSEHSTHDMNSCLVS